MYANVFIFNKVIEFLSIRCVVVKLSEYYNNKWITGFVWTNEINVNWKQNKKKKKKKKEKLYYYMVYWITFTEIIRERGAKRTYQQESKKQVKKNVYK